MNRDRGNPGSCWSWYSFSIQYLAPGRKLNRTKWYLFEQSLIRAEGGLASRQPSVCLPVWLGWWSGCLAHTWSALSPARSTTFVSWPAPLSSRPAVGKNNEERQQSMPSVISPDYRVHQLDTDKSEKITFKSLSINLPKTHCSGREDVWLSGYSVTLLVGHRATQCVTLCLPSTQFQINSSVLPARCFLWVPNGFQNLTWTFHEHLKAFIGTLQVTLGIAYLVNN